MPLIDSAIPLRSTTCTPTVVVLPTAWVSKFTLVWLSDATGAAVADGVTEFDAPDTLAPTELIAVTAKVYAVPFVSPITVAVVLVPGTGVTMPPGVEVTL